MFEKSKVRQSRFRREVEDMLNKGLSAREISKWLKEHRNEMISATTIHSYKKKYLQMRNGTPSMGIYHRNRHNCFNETDHLLDLYLIQLYRLEKCLQQEEESGQLLAGTQKEIELARKLLFECMKIRKDVDDPEEKPLEQEDQPTLREVLNNVPPEQKRSFLASLEDALGRIEGYVKPGNQQGEGDCRER